MILNIQFSKKQNYNFKSKIFFNFLYVESGLLPNNGTEFNIILLALTGAIPNVNKKYKTYCITSQSI